MSDDRDDDGIGYGKPPKSTRFQRHVRQSRGAERAPESATIVRKTVNDVVPVTENGRRR